jgi:NAD(P)-dependent dehydrogenase (short-subunit alcohol dehydrogenase family)
MTLPAARDLGRYGIRVVAIAPGIFSTPMVATLAQDAREELEALAPFPRRSGRPDEFADLVCHVIGNHMINGEIIRIDGGLRMPA